MFASRLIVTLLVATTAALDVSTTHSLLGKRALLLSAALPFEHESPLPIADAVLQQGASVSLLIPNPASGAAAADDASFRLLQEMQRRGHPQLMEALGFAFGGVAGQYGMGNRPRVDFQNVRADDVEALSLAIADHDVLLLQCPSVPLADELERARFRLQRRAFKHVILRLRASDVALRRDHSTRRLHWAWLHQPPPAAEDDSEG